MPALTVRVFSYKTLVQIPPFSLTINIRVQPRGILIVLLFTPLCLARRLPDPGSRVPGPGRLQRDVADDTAPSTHLFFLFTYRAKVIKICVARIVGMDLKFYIALSLASSFAFN